MTKKSVTYVDAARFEELILASGLEVAVQTAFVKVSGPRRGCHIYVAKTNRVGRVDISGFRYEADGVLDLGDDEAFGAVTSSWTSAGRRSRS